MRQIDEDKEVQQTEEALQALQTDIKNTMVISNKTTIFILRTKRDKEINGFILHCEECNQSKAEQELHIRVYPTGHRYK